MEEAKKESIRNQQTSHNSSNVTEKKIIFRDQRTHSNHSNCHQFSFSIQEGRAGPSQYRFVMLSFFCLIFSLELFIFFHFNVNN